MCIRDRDHLGAYYNDDGVNIMVDNVFAPMAQETKMLLQLAEQEMPSLTLHLHGGDNCHGMLMPCLLYTSSTMGKNFIGLLTNKPVDDIKMMSGFMHQKASRIFDFTMPTSKIISTVRAI